MYMMMTPYRHRRRRMRTLMQLVPRRTPIPGWTRDAPVSHIPRSPAACGLHLAGLVRVGVVFDGWFGGLGEVGCAAAAC